MHVVTLKLISSENCIKCDVTKMHEAAIDLMTSSSSLLVLGLRTVWSIRSIIFAIRRWKYKKTKKLSYFKIILVISRIKFFIQDLTT